jgi:hypothetical protein
LIYYLIHALLLLLAIGLIRQNGKNYYTPPVFYSALILKLACGIGMGLLYMHYYNGGDTTQYHSASVQLTQIGKSDTELYWQILQADRAELEGLIPHLPYIKNPRAFFVVKLLSILNVFTGGFYWINSLYLSLFSFWGGWQLSTALARVFPVSKHAAAFAFLFYPSVVFWSSGMLKESLSYGCIGLLCAIFLRFYAHYPKPIRDIPIALVAGWLLWNIKFYYAAVLFPLLLAAGIGLWVLKKFNDQPKKLVLTVAGLLVVTLFAFYTVTRLHYALRLDVLPAYIAEINEEMMTASGPGAAAFFDLSPNYQSLVLNFPKAVATSLFRPLPWEAHAPLALLASIENMLLMLFSLLLACLGVYNITNTNAQPLPTSKRKKGINTWLLTGCALTFVVIMGWLLALSSPNFGTMLRYRIGYLPFYVYLVATGLLYQYMLIKSASQKRQDNS